MVHHPSSWTNNRPVSGTGAPYQATNPVNNVPYWQGREASPDDINNAVIAAHQATQNWQTLSLDAREELLRVYAETLHTHSETITQTISLETGKPLWECRTEVQAMVQKIPISITAYLERCPQKQFPAGNREIHVKHHPHGVMAVLGPFNFPGHLPNGHIVPALLAGNTVVFKPSEHTPQTGLLMAQLWKEAGLPDGVLNLVFGGKDVGKALISHDLISGVCFTGSAAAGIEISQHIAATPWKILALEMGGNNPLIIIDWDDQDAVIDVILISAFQTTGQRCTCARRLILLDTAQNRNMVAHLTKRISALRIGAPDSQPEPFMGPVISAKAAAQIYARYREIMATGASSMVAIQDPNGSAFLNPGLVDTTGLQISDDESFGPLLTLQWCANLDDAYTAAANTQYGLSAGLVAKERVHFETFTQRVPAGIYTYNCPLPAPAVPHPSAVSA